MEKPVEQKEKQTEKAKPLIWDCGSSLYDSFELKSFQHQLDSAIASRTLSMPHLSNGRVLKQPPQPQPLSSKKLSKFSRSIHKLLRSVFKPKLQNNNSLFQRQDQLQDGFYVVYDRSGALSTIAEGPEFDGLSPEIRSMVTRTSSERFTATSIGISCA